MQPIGTRKGQTVYFAQPKIQQYFTNKMLIECIVCETSLSEDDVKNALNPPKILFTPKQKMRDAANAVELSIDRSTVKASTGGGTATEPSEGETEDPLG